MEVRGRNVEVPAAPSLLPDELKAKWTRDYEEAYQEAAESVADANFDEIECRAAASRVANKVLRVRAPRSYAEAEAIPSWQIHARKREAGLLTIVTIDGKKYRFDVPGEDRVKEPGPDPERARFRLSPHLG